MFLCNILQYPEGLRKYEYIPGFAIRGLHYDIHKVHMKHFFSQLIIFHKLWLLLEE